MPTEKSNVKFVTQDVLNKYTSKVKDQIQSDLSEIPIASQSNFGLVKSGSNTVATEGLTPCPIINGIPYYGGFKKLKYGSIILSPTDDQISYHNPTIKDIFSMSIPNSPEAAANAYSFPIVIPVPDGSMINSFSSYINNYYVTTKNQGSIITYQLYVFFVKKVDARFYWITY